MDTIPMHEIQTVSELNDDSTSGFRRPSALAEGYLREYPSMDISKSCAPMQKNAQHLNAEGEKKCIVKGGRNMAMQITTIPDGFNFGKTYYLRAPCNNKNQKFVQKLSMAIHLAKIRAHRMSVFQKVQGAVKRIQESFAFQMTIAALIIAVDL